MDQNKNANTGDQQRQGGQRPDQDRESEKGAGDRQTQNQPGKQGNQGGQQGNQGGQQGNQGGRQGGGQGGNR